MFDLYIIGSDDTVVENTNEGIDTVQIYDSYTLGVNVENLILMGTNNLNGTGNDLDNYITGNSGNNIIDGGVGNNILYGNAGNDTLIGGTGNDTISDSSGNDVYLFNIGDNVDSITDSAGTELITLGNNVNKNNVAFFTDASGYFSLDYGDSAGNDKVTVNSWSSSTYNQIERIQLDDGTYITNTEANTIIQNMITYATAHSISLTSVEDVRNNSELMSLYMNNSWHS
ncbi:MAG TPA: hypothetical protein DDW90_08380 [Cyanobacteria bacterium UBA9971]|nr:hypothetical protein [Cyanobacteria bacterium UBA9971]